MRLALAALVTLLMGCAIAGIGMGEAPAERERAPTAARQDAARQRIAAGGAAVARGRELFADEGCDRCHSIAAVAAGGMLGPRLDTLDEDRDDIAESIAAPRRDTVDGYPEKLMPTDYAQRMGEADVQALAAFIAAVSGAEDGGDDGRSGRGRGRGGDDDGRGRGRGRGGDG